MKRKLLFIIVSLCFLFLCSCDKYDNAIRQFNAALDDIAGDYELTEAWFADNRLKSIDLNGDNRSTNELYVEFSSLETFYPDYSAKVWRSMYYGSKGRISLTFPIQAVKIFNDSVNVEDSNSAAKTFCWTDYVISSGFKPLTIPIIDFSNNERPYFDYLSDGVISFPEPGVMTFEVTEMMYDYYSDTYGLERVEYVYTRTKVDEGYDN